MAWWRRPQGSPDSAPGRPLPSARPPSDLFPPFTAPEFERWQRISVPALARFTDGYLPELGIDADYSEASLRALGSILHQRYPDQRDPLTHPVDADFLDGAQRYVGECFLREIPGRWGVSTQIGATQGIPVIWLDRPGAVPICPLHLVTASVLRDEPDLLARVLRAQLDAATPLPDVAPSAEAPELRVASGVAPEVGARTQAWCDTVVERIAWLATLIDAPLDDSDASLATVLQHATATLPSSAAMADPAHRDLTLAYAAYVGAAMLKRQPGGWLMGAGEPNYEQGDMYAGLPSIMREYDKNATVTGFPWFAAYFALDGEADPIALSCGDYLTT